MSKSILIIAMSLALAGCTQKDIDSACAEISSTRVMDSNVRMNILKEYGFSPIEASLYEDYLFDVIQPLAETYNSLSPDRVSTLTLESQRAHHCIGITLPTCAGILNLIDKGADRMELDVIDGAKWVACEVAWDEAKNVK